MKAIITVGVSASGKTTFARNLQHEDASWSIVSRDDIRYHILDEKGLIEDYSLDGIPWKNWNWKWEREVTDRYWQSVEHFNLHGRNLILADTNLNDKFRKETITKLEALGYTVEIKEFPITIEEAWKRDAARSNGVGHDVIAKQYQQWLDYLESKGEWERVKFNPKLPAAVIVDIDGTLAHMNGRRGPFEWDKVGLDSVDIQVREIVNSMDQQYQIIVMSGRDSVCRGDTQDWLQDNDVMYDELYMREKGDMRKDAEVKWHLYKKFVDGRFNVFFVIDDRPSMVRMWADRGFKVFAVGNQNIEF